jgi:multiple sugar transport system substrate-binding protein
MLNRRHILGGLAASTAVGNWASAWAQAAPFKAEKGAAITLLRWKRFVESEEVGFNKLVAAFEKATGVKVTVVNEGLDDVQPKASVAANTGKGYDMAWGLYSLPHLFPQKCVDISDVCNYLDKKYGGFAPSAVAYGKSGGKWIGLPVAYNANIVNYRISSINKAGFSSFPKTNDAFLALVKALKANNTPAGFAFGRASGDGNGWAHWALWSHGANLVDAKDQVVINSAETVKALEFAKAIYDNSIAGTASWNDASNNKAFLEGEVHCTNNGVSIYAAAKAQGRKNIVDDMDHADWPIGPVGKATAFHSAYPILAFKHTKFPNACKAFMAFMMEAENYNPWLEAAVGYLSHPLKAYDANPVWVSDPKLAGAKYAAMNTLTAGGLGSVGEKAATALADFVVLDMFAAYATGRSTAKEAISIAERQAKRIYR